MARIVGTLYIALFLRVYYTSLLSETLFMSILGALLFALLHYGRTGGSKEANGWWLAAVWAAGSLMMLTRNLTLAFLPGAGLAVYFGLTECITGANSG